MRTDGILLTLNWRLNVDKSCLVILKTDLARMANLELSARTKCAIYYCSLHLVLN